MSFSVSASTKFSEINWDNFEDRPEVNDSMPLCSDSNWEYDVPCCTDGYVISDALQMAYELKKESSAAARFLSKYPCINSLEFEKIADELIPASLGVDNFDSPPSRFPPKWLSFVGLVRSCADKLFSWLK